MSTTPNIELQRLNAEDNVDFNTLNENYDKIDNKFGAVDEAIAAVETTPGEKGDKGDTGDRGLRGLQGIPGTPGSKLYETNGQPDDGVGINGDWAIDQDLSQIWGPKATGSWDGTGPFSFKGAQGEDGESTITIYSMLVAGHGDPTEEPENFTDQFHAYVDIDDRGRVWTWNVTNQEWDSTGIYIVGNNGTNGEDGEDGEDGADGVRGSLIHKVSAAPSYNSDRDNEGDWAFRTNGDVYGPLVDNAWPDSPAFSIKGPQGTQGNPGDQGDQGEPGLDAPQNVSGIVDRDDAVTLTFNAINRHVDLTPTVESFVLFVKGTKFVKTGATVTISDFSGVHYVYFNTSGALIDSLTPWDLMNVTPVAIVVWDADHDDGWAIDKLAEISMGTTTRRLMSSRFGPFVSDGFWPADGYILAPGTPSIATNSPSVPTGTIDDADVRTVIEELSDGGPYVVLYRNGTGGKWEWQRGQGLPYLANSTYMDYNHRDDDEWTFQDTGQDGKFYNSYIVAMGALEGVFRLAVIMGQAEHDTLDDALNEEFADLDLTGLPIASIAPLWQFTFETDASWDSVAGQARVAQATWIAGVVIVGAGSHDVPPAVSLLWTTHVVDSDYTFVAGDDSRAILLLDTTDQSIELAVPDEEEPFEIGDEVVVIWRDGSNPVIMGSTGDADLLSVYGPDEALTFDALGGKATFLKIDANLWQVSGDVHASGSLIGVRTVDLDDHQVEM